MDIFLFFHFDLGDIPVQHVEYEENPYGGSWVYLGVKLCYKNVYFAYPSPETRVNKIVSTMVREVSRMGIRTNQNGPPQSSQEENRGHVKIPLINLGSKFRGP